MQLGKPLAIGLLASSLSLLAHPAPQAPVSVVQNGVAVGGIHGTVPSKLGQMRGRVTDQNGVVYRLQASVEPGPTAAGQWSGFTPVGPIKGELVPVSGTPITNQIDVLGTYSMDPDGTGNFSLALYRPQTSIADPGEALGTLVGTFSDANTLNPATLLPDFGPFEGRWQMEL